MNKCPMKKCGFSNIFSVLLINTIVLMAVGYLIGTKIEDTTYRVVVFIVVLVIYFILEYFFVNRLVSSSPEEEKENEEVMKNYTEVAKQVIEGLGGKENIVTIDNCITRLRMELQDSSKVNKIILKQAGAIDTIVVDKSSVQVIMGPEVQFIAEEMKKLKK